MLCAYACIYCRARRGCPAIISHLLSLCSFPENVPANWPCRRPGLRASLLTQVVADTRMSIKKHMLPYSGASFDADRSNVCRQLQNFVIPPQLPDTVRCNTRVGHIGRNLSIWLRRICMRVYNNEHINIMILKRWSRQCNKAVAAVLGPLMECQRHWMHTPWIPQSVARQ